MLYFVLSHLQVASQFILLVKSIPVLSKFICFKYFLNFVFTFILPLLDRKFVEFYFCCKIIYFFLLV